MKTSLWCGVKMHFGSSLRDGLGFIHLKSKLEVSGGYILMKYYE